MGQVTENSMFLKSCEKHGTDRQHAIAHCYPEQPDDRLLNSVKDPILRSYTILYDTTHSIVNLNQPVRFLLISCHIHAVRMIVAQIFK